MYFLCIYRQGVDGSEVQLSAEAWGAQLLADSESANEISEQLTDEDRNLAAALVQFVQRQPLIGALNQIEKAHLQLIIISLNGCIKIFQCIMYVLHYRLSMIAQIQKHLMDFWNIPYGYITVQMSLVFIVFWYFIKY